MIHMSRHRFKATMVIKPKWCYGVTINRLELMELRSKVMMTKHLSHPSPTRKVMMAKHLSHPSPTRKAMMAKHLSHLSPTRKAMMAKHFPHLSPKTRAHTSSAVLHTGSPSPPWYRVLSPSGQVDSLQTCFSHLQCTRFVRQR